MALAKAISLHVGLNFVDPDQYEGWDGELAACEFDAKDMLSIAKRKKFTKSSILLNEQATAAAVTSAIADAAKKLAKGGLFLLTYSGHGGQVPDRNSDEKDRNDETWVLFDRMLVDDETFELWRKFKPGARVFVLSDSCHSGTVTRMAPAFVGGGARARLMPRKINDKVYKAHKAKYDKIQRGVKRAEDGGVKASVVLISGCQDNQVSLDGDRNGAFTGVLRKVWNGGKFTGNYRRFHDEISAKMPHTQSPNYYVVGAPSPKFEDQSPFTV